MSSGASLCGPSNALSSLQKHVSSDRAHQQDRLRHQAGPSSGFRSNPAANLGHEFEQFSNAARFPHQDVQFFPQRNQFHPPPQLHQPAPMPNWAAEFQRMTLQQAPILPAPIALNRPQEPRGSWHTEFLAQAHQPAPMGFIPPQQSHFIQPQVQQPQYQPQHQEQHFESSMSSGPEIRTHSPSMYASEESYSPQHESFYTTSSSDVHYHHYPDTALSADEKAASDAAFERAFEEAHRWQFESAQEEQQQQQPQQQQQQQKRQLQSDLFRQHDEIDAISQPQTNERHVAVEPEAETQTQPQPEHEDNDELSKTAGQLLESLSQNQSKKFQESNFLALMRKLRDKEVKVEGGEMVEVSGGP